MSNEQSHWYGAFKPSKNDTAPVKPFKKIPPVDFQKRIFQREREREGERESQTDRQTERDRERQRETEGDRERQRERGCSTDYLWLLILS